MGISRAGPRECSNGMLLFRRRRSRPSSKGLPCEPCPFRRRASPRCLETWMYGRLGWPGLAGWGSSRMPRTILNLPGSINPFVIPSAENTHTHRAAERPSGTGTWGSLHCPLWLTTSSVAILRVASLDRQRGQTAFDAAVGLPPSAIESHLTILLQCEWLNGRWARLGGAVACRGHCLHYLGSYWIRANVFAIPTAIQQHNVLTSGDRNPKWPDPLVLCGNQWGAPRFHQNCQRKVGGSIGSLTYSSMCHGKHGVRSTSNGPEE